MSKEHINVCPSCASHYEIVCKDCGIDMEELEVYLQIYYFGENLAKYISDETYKSMYEDLEIALENLLDYKRRTNK
jgi:hypothetical protein